MTWQTWAIAFSGFVAGWLLGAVMGWRAAIARVVRELDDMQVKG